MQSLCVIKGILSILLQNTPINDCFLT
jgi:hypothetical protein